MKIAQVCPLYESSLPKETKKVVSYLTEELVGQGHEVTLFASGDSETLAKLLSPCKKALKLADDVKDHMVYDMLLLDSVMKRKDEFDIIHFHTDYIHFPWVNNFNIPSLTTLYGRLDSPDLIPFFEVFRNIPLVSISNSHRSPFKNLNWKGTIYHGLPKDLLRHCEVKDDYVAFLGGIFPENGIEEAIEIANKANVKLKISAKIDEENRQYFEDVICPMIENGNIEFVGEISENEKGDFLGRSRALLLPIDWPEPFGMAMIEALACGTPIIAYDKGSVREIVIDGVNGYIVKDVDSAVYAINKLDRIRPSICREDFEQRFTVDRMAKDYLYLYKLLSCPFLNRNEKKYNDDYQSSIAYLS